MKMAMSIVKLLKNKYYSIIIIDEDGNPYSMIEN